MTDLGCWAVATRTTYLVPGTILRHERGVTKGKGRDAAVGALPPPENALLLHLGDLLILTRDQEPGRPATQDSGGQVLLRPGSAARFRGVRRRPVGGVIWFDDGKIGGVVEKVERGRRSSGSPTLTRMVESCAGQGD